MKVAQIFQYFVLFSLTFAITTNSTKINSIHSDSPADWYIFQDEGPPFCYNESEPCGPSHWGGFCNSGNQRRQSPLDLSHVNTNGGIWDIIRNPLYRLTLSPGYEETFQSFAIQNDGHSIQISLPPSATDKLRISYDTLGQKQYQFFRIHFHWGLNDKEGSEHILNGANYAMELHMVHYSLKYASMEDALAATDDPEAVSVIGVFVQVCAVGSKATAFQQIQKYVEEVGSVPSEDMIQVRAPFSLAPFLPSAQALFLPRARALAHYSYLGSLTTPSCLELVRWTVLQKSICILPEELKAFQNVMSHGGLPLDTNHRPVQSLGKRIVTFHKS